MPGEPVETFIGWTGVGFGALIVYSAYKKYNLFGPTGLIPLTLKNGRLPTAEDLALAEVPDNASQIGGPNADVPEGDPHIPKTAPKPPNCGAGKQAWWSFQHNSWYCLPLAQFPPSSIGSTKPSDSQRA